MSAGRRRTLALGLAVVAVSARAQQPVVAWGQIYGTAHQPVPPAQPVAVRPLDDRPTNVQLARRFADALRRAGRGAAGPSAPLVLNFETEIERVPRRLQRGVDSTGRVKFVIQATLDDAQRFQRLWSGEASYLGPANDEALIFGQLAQLLVDELGKTSRVRGFTLE